MTMTTQSFDKAFVIAHERGVPIIVVKTADQFATAQVIRQHTPEFAAVVHWDASRGLTPVIDVATDKPVETSVKALAGLNVTQDNTVQFVDALSAIQRMPRASVTVAFNANLQVQASEPLAVANNIQAIANLRDQFKSDFRMLVLLGPEFVVPSALEHDVVVFDHALPGTEVLAALVRQVHVSAECQEPSPETVDEAVEALRGMSEFAAEQQTAIALVLDEKDASKGYLDLDALWDRKRVTIEQTRGLKVWRGQERFSDIVGCDSVKQCLLEQIGGRRSIGVPVFIDEIDKVFANIEHDTSGARMYQLRAMLTKMEDCEWGGIMLVGVAGAGKTLIGKAFGNEAKLPTIAVDFGEMEAPHVGESEALVRHAMAVIEAIGSGNAFVIATSNNASVMRPELQRRFTEGTFFFDLMTKAEREAAWRFYINKYGLEDKFIPDDDGWTGAEIRNCCRRAWNTRKSLLEAAQFIVPMARSRIADIEALRQTANNTMLDANKPGMYRYTAEPMQRMVEDVTVKGVRAIALPNGLVPALDQMKES